MPYNFHPQKGQPWTEISSGQVQNVTSPNDEQWGGDASQANTMSRGQRKRWDPYHKKAGRVWHQDPPRNAPSGPRSMTDRVSFNSGRHDRNHQPHQQPLWNGRSSPMMSPFAPPDQPVRRIGPLPPDHPLKVEMEELKQTRKSRQYYWAGLIEDLGEEEWENLANYDRQRWEEENTLADQKFEDLAGQIKLAEMGIIDASTQPEASLSLSATQGSKLETSKERTRTRRARRKRPLERGRRHDTKPQAPSSRRPNRQNPKISKVSNVRPTPKYPRGSVIWTEDGKIEAVQKWMDEMGMNRTSIRDENGESLVADGSMRSDEMMSNGGYSRSNDPDHEAMSDSPLRFPEQDDLAADNVGNGAVRNSEPTLKAAELSAEPLWTAQEDAIFEEAEATREAHRMQLAQLMTIENERRGLLDPSKTARLAQDDRISAKTIDESSFIETEGIAMDIAGSTTETQGQHPSAVMANRADQTTAAHNAKSIMDALLIQLGASRQSLQDLALATTRNVEKPPLSEVMSNEGNQSEITAAASLNAMAPTATRTVQTLDPSTTVPQDGDQLGVSTQENTSLESLAESQLLAEFEQSLVGTPTEEQPDMSTMEGLRAFALTATQGVEESEELYVAPTTGEQIDAFSLEDLQTLALAVTEGIKEAEQSQSGEIHVERPAALTMLDMQALALAATNGLEVPEPLETLASDGVHREVTAADSALTVPGADEDQVEAKVVVKKSTGGYRKRPVAGDFMDIDMVPVETVDMQDVPSSDSEISGQITRDREDIKNSNGPVKPMESPSEFGAASTDDGPHTLYVGVLPKDVTKAQLEELFTGFNM